MEVTRTTGALETPNLLPSPPLSGRCQCPSNGVEYTISAPPESLNVCYCLECQRQSGSAFALTLVVPSSALLVSSRSVMRLRHFERKTESGGSREGVFCFKCGIRLWHFDAANPEWASVKAGTLDSKVDFRAAIHIWAKRKLVGLVLPEGAEVYDEDPPEGPVWRVLTEFIGRVVQFTQINEQGGNWLNTLRGLLLSQYCNNDLCWPINQRYPSIVLEILVGAVNAPKWMEGLLTVTIVATGEYIRLCLCRKFFCLV